MSSPFKGKGPARRSQPSHSPQRHPIDLHDLHLADNETIDEGSEVDVALEDWIESTSQRIAKADNTLFLQSLQPEEIANLVSF